MELSAKAIKKLTKDELNYDLSSNAFELLNKRAADLLQEGHTNEVINEWLFNVLKIAGEQIEDNARRVVKRSVMESIIDHVNLRDTVKGTEIEHLTVQETPISDKIIDFESVTSCNWRTVDIVQVNPSVRELEEEIERLKKIIQIILNKQAELS